MLGILSPAKTLNRNLKEDTFPNESLDFQKEVNELIEVLLEYSLDEICNLMKVSEKLGLLNYDRFRNFFSEETRSYTAILAFMGEAYRGLDGESLSKEDLEYSEGVLRILSGLYGVIKPLSKIKEYRLEMGTKLKTYKGNNLYEFWGDKVTKSILEAIEKSPGEKVLVNVASKEYTKVLDIEKIKKRYRVLDIVFFEYKDGSYKNITVYSKKARGLMIRYMIENKITKAEELKEFDLEGYKFNEVLSKENEFVFTR